MQSLCGIDRTILVRTLYERRREQLDALEPLGARETSLSSLPCSSPPLDDPQHSLQESFNSVVAQVVNALVNARTSLISLSRSLFFEDPPLKDLEQQLLLTDASITATIEAVDGLLGLLRDAMRSVRQQEQQRDTLKRIEKKKVIGAIFGLFTMKEEGESLDDSENSNSGEDSEKPHGAGRFASVQLQDALAHYCAACGILKERLNAARLSVTVAREELEEHRAALTEPVALWLTLDNSSMGGVSGVGRGGVASSSMTGTACTGKNGVTPAGKESVRGGGNPFQLASKFISMTTQGNKAVEGAISRSAETLSNSVLSLARGHRHPAGALGISGPEFKSHLDEHMLTEYNYSPEERATLERQRAAMIAEEQMSNATAAKAIEATINELGNLTSLMQGKVLEQDDQLTEIENNGLEAQAFLEKAALELQKPMGTRWNIKRILTLVMWIEILVILIAHTIIR